ncbi:hypothetical protein DUI87_00654 [Hirundo rustica rustica]|uniref:ribonuclease H n=1 Tax=Hirundo rustica rustica TaxID=333673 RepID=A0A3M0L9R4_HIRRU|nr:hypothetical protein DUI87_00654 [Hirundo rustica rustica]
MDSTEFKLWEAAWRQLLREALPSLLTDPETAIDENGNALPLEQLMGEGRWTDLTDQASGIPIKALQTIRQHAVTAFFSMVPDGPVIPYNKIVQGTKEAFTKFVERLTRAIEVQVAEVAVREGILRELVFANANGLCRNAILSLPLDPPPTLQDMLRVCQLKVPYMQAAGQAIIHHYIDDVLVCAPTDDVLTHALDLTINALIAAGFELQEEKVQRMPPWKYLGLEIGKRTIVPQKLAIKTKWKDIPKKDRDGKDPLSIIEWVFLSHQRSKRMTRPQELVAELIRKARFRIRELAGWEKAGDVIKHLIHAFSFLGIPKELKTDNGPVYKSRELCSFLQQWGVEHKTGIPHSPTDRIPRSEEIPPNPRSPDIAQPVSLSRRMAGPTTKSKCVGNPGAGNGTRSYLPREPIIESRGHPHCHPTDARDGDKHEESPEEEGLELEEVLEEAPEDDRRGLNEEEHGLGYPMQYH